VTVRHEVGWALGAAVLGGVLLLVAEPRLGFVALAGTGAAALLSPRARRLLALVLVLVGVAAGALAASRSDPLLGTGSLLLMAAAGAALVRSSRWPPPRRGEEPGPSRGPSDRDTWEALDRGEDPTA
jgi:hypothetical protein